MQQVKRDPAWLEIGKREIGVHEIAGVDHEGRILGYWPAAKIAAPREGLSDEVPWCAVFVGAMLEQAGVGSARSAAAQAYLTWGAALDPAHPPVGAVAVFRWASGGHHVAFVVGLEAERVHVLGGNQGDAVTVRGFPRERLVAVRWPAAP